MLTRGRVAKPVQITEVRALTRADLEDIKAKRTAPVVKRFRDPHHRVARLVASGLRPRDVADACGFSIDRIYSLQADPTFQELVATYRKDVSEAYVSAEEERYRTATAVNMKALRQLNEKLDEADETGELLPTRELVSIFADTSDRVGIQKRSTQNSNINIDFAARLEEAIARSAAATSLGPRAPTTIDVTPSSPSAPASSLPAIRRRA